MRNRAGTTNRNETEFINAGTAGVDNPLNQSVEIPEPVKVSKAKPVSISLAEENYLSIDRHIRNEVMHGNTRANRSDIVRAAILALDKLSQNEVSELIQRSKLK